MYEMVGPTSRDLGTNGHMCRSNKSHNNHFFCEPICGWIGRGAMVSPDHQGPNPGAHIYHGFISGVRALTSVLC